MHKLTRPAAPSCLRKYSYKKHHWKDVSSKDKGDIWCQLDHMQGKRCAYCEAAIITTKEDSTSHIEHFQQRARTRKETFAWDNLFGSCNRQDSCGKHKDEQQYQPTDLIKPDIEDPEQLLIFVPDGSVHPKAGLSDIDRRRASETIRIFNLNGSLQEIRKFEVIGYVQTAEEIAEIAAEYGPEEWLPLLQEELDKVQGLPFETAIRHILFQ